MPKDIDSRLNDTLDITSDIKVQTGEIVREVKKLPTTTDQSESIVNDYKYTRENLYGLVERGQDAIEGILDVCKETENPRAYEVAGQLIKTVGETAEKLLDVQHKLKKLQDEDAAAGKIGTQHNHLYVGSTSELQKFLKKQKSVD
jgi:hypothetical protein|tara:strand:+ start:2470 stop:2904 length:435 start_codon:yes stop_codon:yes gene_type:complete